MAMMVMMTATMLILLCVLLLAVLVFVLMTMSAITSNALRLPLLLLDYHMGLSLLCATASVVGRGS